MREREMKVVFAIAWRGFKSLFLSPFMHLILGCVAVLMSFFYMRNLLLFAARSRMVMPGGEGPSIQMDLFAQHISVVHLLMILITPVLTMRLLAEERKMRTYDLLLTSPI